VAAGGREPAGLHRPVKYDLPGIRERMKKRLVEMREVGRRHEQDADRACDDMVESQGEIDRAEEEVPKLAAKHVFYQELRGYVTDYTDCYDEKVGTVAYLESRLCKAASERRGKLRERRRQDVKDQAEQLAALSATATYLGVAAGLGTDPVQEEARAHRVAEREGRRTRRRQARQQAGRVRHNDGASSDDELPGKEQAVVDKARREVVEQAGRVMEDVAEDFSDLARVAARLGAWRETDSESYQSAYVSLCLHRIFSPLIRHQQLLWNPFQSTAAISEQAWHGQLAGYYLVQGETEEQFGQDPDRNLLSSICEKVALPKLVNLVRATYDPVSTGHNQRLAGCVARTVQDFPSVTPR
jgi:GC-rich sequence DNA-binding factor